MEVVQVQALSFDLASGASSATATLSGFSIVGQMVPIFASWRVTTGQSPVLASTTELDVYVSSNTQLTVERWSSPAYAMRITVYVVEFGSDTTVQSGTWSMDSSTTTTTAAISAVTLSNTFGFHYRKNEGEAAPTYDSDPDGRITSFKFNSTTQLGFQRHVAKGACQGHWYTVSSNTLTVEHGSHSISGGTATSVTDALVATVTTGNTFILVSYRTDEAVYNDEGCWVSDLQDSNTIRFRRSYSAANTNTWEYMIVSDSRLSVQRGEFTTTGTTDNDTITEVDINRAASKTGCGKSGFASSSDYVNGNLDGRYWEMYFGPATQINGQAGQGMAGLIVTWEVVQFYYPYTENGYGMRFYGGANQALTSVSSFTPPTNCSVCFWIYPKTLGTRVLGCHNLWEVSFDLTTPTSGKISNDLFQSTPNFFSTGGLNVDTLYHVVCTRASDDSAAIYFNGALDSTNSNNSGSPSAGNLKIGTRDTELQYLNGYLEDVRIYDRVLSADEVKTMYTCRGIDNITYGLLHRWPLDELPMDSTASGTGSVKDFGPSQNNMTPTNGPEYTGSRIRTMRFV